MLKKSSTLVVICSLLILNLAPAALAQAEPKVIESSQGSTAISEKPELKTLIANADKKASDRTFDPVAADKTHERSQAQQKKGWSTQKKLIVAGVIVGIAALVFVLVKYGKDCIRSSPAGCTPGVDEFCTCEEYERRNP